MPDVGIARIRGCRVGCVQVGPGAGGKQGSPLSGVFSAFAQTGRRAEVMSVKATVALIMLAAAGVWAGVMAAKYFLGVMQRFNSDSVWDDEDDYY